jgi:hypothetical protein
MTKFIERKRERERERERSGYKKIQNIYAEEILF